MIICGNCDSNNTIINSYATRIIIVTHNVDCLHSRNSWCSDAMVMTKEDVLKLKVCISSILTTIIINTSTKSIFTLS